MVPGQAREGFWHQRGEAVVPINWAIIGLLFCTIVGVAFGMLPAIKASRLHPIDALRYE
jgi:putative ABC transport system permease protein